MAITDILERIGSKLADFKGVILIGKDALVVEKYGDDDPSFDNLAVEFLSLLHKFDGILEERGDGPLVETTLHGGETNYFLSSVNENYYLFLGIGGKEVVGRCRYELQKACIDLRRELAE